MKPMETKRQKQIAKTVQLAMNDVFREHGAELFGQALVTITDVFVTKDLQLARIYLSFLNTDKEQEIIKTFRANSTQLRTLLAAKIRNKVRLIPQLEFFKDEAIERSERLDDIFKQIKKDKPD